MIPRTFDVFQELQEEYHSFDMKHWTIFAFLFAIYVEVTQCQGVNLTFPENFLIGAATASHQVEGAWNASDKGENSWDYFTHNRPELIADGSNADIACDSYNKYEEDVQWIKDLGLDFYRFSLSWSRILPNGFADTISEDGIQYYTNLIEALHANNITPVVTLYHWDHPQVLEELGGWTNEMMVEWFGDYARVVFEKLGHLVKIFLTINEPKVLCDGYIGTAKAPGKVLENMGQYLCVHNSLKAHATAYHIYDDEFRATQGGQVAIVAPCRGFVSGDNTTDESIERAFLFDCGWVMHPIYIGDYPEIMRSRIDTISKLEGYPFSRLPTFSEEWIEKIKGTSDFFGLNSYTSSMPVFDPEEDEELGIYNIDSGIIATVDSTWSIAASSWLYVVPEGFGNLLRLIRDHYDNPPVRIFENGYSDTGELDDYARIDYYHQYLTEILTAINDDGCNVEAYTIWSLLDNFEWSRGYTERFGIISVDFESENRTRISKLSTEWWKEVISTRTLQDVPTASNRR